MIIRRQLAVNQHMSMIGAGVQMLGSLHCLQHGFNGAVTVGVDSNLQICVMVFFYEVI
jgi:hypothetical protein